MNPRENLLRAQSNLEDAEVALAQAEAQHQEAFCNALVELFNQYGLAVEAGGSEGSCLELRWLNSDYPYERRNLGL